MKNAEEFSVQGYPDSFYISKYPHQTDQYLHKDGLTKKWCGDRWNTRHEAELFLEEYQAKNKIQELQLQIDSQLRALGSLEKELASAKLNLEQQKNPVPRHGDVVLIEGQIRLVLHYGRREGYTDPFLAVTSSGIADNSRPGWIKLSYENRTYKVIGNIFDDDILEEAYLEN